MAASTALAVPRESFGAPSGHVMHSHRSTLMKVRIRTDTWICVKQKWYTQAYDDSAMIGFEMINRFYILYNSTFLAFLLSMLTSEDVIERTPVIVQCHDVIQ